MLFFEPTEIHSAACTVRFTAKDGADVRGICELLLHDGLADVVLCRLSSGDLSVAEGLLRAAFNYAANRGCYIGCFSVPDSDEMRRLLPFEWKHGRWCNDIPTLLRGACRGN